MIGEPLVESSMFLTFITDETSRKLLISVDLVIDLCDPQVWLKSRN